MKAKHTVSIVQRRLTDYRVPFFESLRTRLSDRGIRLRLLHGTGTVQELARDDEGHIEWAELLDTKYIFRDRFCWQSFSRRVNDSDLVIIPHENALLANHLLPLRRYGQRIAYWGHGANLRINHDTVSERYKRWSCRLAHWYFAYTQMSVDLVSATGFPREKITCVNNSIDIQRVELDINSVGEGELVGLRTELGLRPGPIGLYIGSFYRQKRLEFLLDAALLIRKKIPDFQMVLVGGGKDTSHVEAISSQFDWLHYLGVRKGREKALVLMLADIFMCPGGLGLGILDAFAAGLPVVTTSCGLHGPEIAYLDPENGIATENTLMDYVAGCERLLGDKAFRTSLGQGSTKSAALYTLPLMVEKFSEGITRALESGS